MGKEVRYTLNNETCITAEQIAMIEAARELEPVYDEDAPEADPVAAPKAYEALIRAVAERNQRIARLAKQRA